MDLNRKKKEPMDYSLSILLENLSKDRVEKDPKETELVNKKMAAVNESYSQNKVARKKWLRR